MITHSGQELFTMQISHGRTRGTKVTVKTAALIEDFMASMGDGSTQEVPMGSLYTSLSGEPLQLYAHGNGDMPAPDVSQWCTLADPRHGLLVDGTLPNLTFLRFKGISSGLSFNVKAVYSLEGMQDLKTKIIRAIRSMCREYIVPATVKIVVVGDDSYGA